YAVTLGGPPDHRMVAIDLQRCVRAAIDRCGAPLAPDGAGRLVKLTSDEVAGQGAHDPQMSIDGPARFEVRRDRSGGGDGRVYTAVFEVVDGWGDATRAACRVQVPHDARAGAAAVDSGPHACVGDCP